MIFVPWLLWSSTFSSMIFSWDGVFLKAPSELHQLCLQLNSTNYSVDLFLLRKALVCGAPLSDAHLSSLFQNTGLSHLLVISGAHLVWIELWLSRILKLLRWPGRTPIYVLLFIFVSVFQWRPPVTRALTSFFVRELSLKYKLHWTPAQACLLVGSLLLFFYPAWWKSLSFLLSWSASLLVTNLNLNRLRGHLFMFVFLQPFFLYLGAPHPVSILCNWLVTPLMAALLFPLTVLSLFVTPVEHLAVPLWQILFWFLKQVQFNFPGSPQTFVFPLFYLWVYLAILHLGFECKRWFQQGKSP